MKATLMVAFLLLGSGLSLATVPDFAFPKTVIADAENSLKESLKTKNQGELTRSVIEIVIASSLIEPDSIADSLKLLHEAQHVTDGAWSKLLYLIEARYYTDIYQQNRHKYNNRSLPSGDISVNPLEWSADQFASKVYFLLKRVNQLSQFPDLTPISDFPQVIENAEEASAEGWTIGDFIYLSSIRTASVFYNSSAEQIPFFNSESPYSKMSESSKLKSFAVELAENWGSSAKKRLLPDLYAEALIQKSMTMASPNAVKFIWGMSQRLKRDECSLKLLNHISASLLQNYEIATSQDYYVAVRKAIDSFPASRYVPALKNKLADLASTRVDISMSSKFIPGDSIRGDAVLRNLKSDVLKLYRLKRNIPADFYRMRTLEGAEFVKSFNVGTSSSNNSVYPFSDTIRFKFPSLPIGDYALVSSLYKSGDKNWYNQICTFSVTGVNGVVANESGKNKVYLFDAENMEPLTGYVVECFLTENNQKIPERLTTSKEGWVDLPQKNCYVSASGEKGFWSSVSYPSRNSKSGKEDRMMEILTDRSLCHPGDSIIFVAVTYSKSHNELNQISNTHIIVALSDPNCQVVDSLHLVTDADGRCTGSFKVPSHGLLGRFQIRGDYEEAENQRNGFSSSVDKLPVYFNEGYAWFDVAEYKRPTFEVVVEKPATGFKVGETILLRGYAKTWSGVPVENVDAAFEISTIPSFWRSVRQPASFSGEVKTDDNGKFEIKLPTRYLKGTPYENASYRVNVTVTARSGESQRSNDVIFSIGESNRLRVNMPEICDASKSDNKLKIEADYVSPSGEALKKSISYVVRDEKGLIVTSGSFVSPEELLNVSELKPAKYEITFNDEITRSFILTGGLKDKSPAGLRLWIPQKKVIPTFEEEYVNVYFGTDIPGGQFLCQVSDSDGKAVYHRVKSDRNGYGKLKVSVPANDNRKFIKVLTSNNFETALETVTIYPASEADTLNVEVISMRNKLVPGNKETWTFRFKNGNTAVSDLPVLAVMTDKSLNSLAEFKWNFNPSNYIYFYSICNMQGAEGGGSWASSQTPVKMLPFSAPLVPKWNFFGYPLYGSSLRYGFDGIMIRGRGANSSVEDKLMYKSEAGEAVAATAIQFAMADRAEAAESESSDDADTGSIGNTTADVKFRESELPVAFFKPLLLSDKNGDVDIIFEVPDFNTTWQFQLLGYTGNLKSAYFSADAVASKPVMLSLNVPRFARICDEVIFDALVSNDADEDLMADVKIELFDPLTDEVLETFNYNNQLLRNGKSDDFKARFRFDKLTEGIGIRGAVSTGSFTDGEMTVIPVLPASVPVVDANNFYLKPSEETFQMRLTEFNNNADITLNICSNPVWYCLSSLSDNLNVDSENLLTIIDSYYVNVASSSIIEKNKSVKDALKDYFSNSNLSADAELNSPLDRNDNLRQIKLAFTPWVNNAANETMRFKQFENLLDPISHAVKLNNMISKIAGRQDKNGMLSWFEGMSGTPFITNRVLSRLGQLNRYNYIDNSTPTLKRVISSAVSGIEKYYLEQRKKNHGNFSVTEMADYMLIRGDLEAGNNRLGVPAMSPSFKKFAGDLYASITKNWKSLSLESKAKVVILLNSEISSSFIKPDQKQKLVGNLLRSLKEFSVSSSQKGVFYESLNNQWGFSDPIVITSEILEAFASVAGYEDMVDGLRQWLVMQRQISDWGSSAATVSAVNAILSCGSDWTQVAEPAEIFINGERIEIDSAQSLTGNVTANLNSKTSGNGLLEIHRKGISPAWGGVVAQYSLPIKEVTAKSVDGLKISRKLMKLKDVNGINKPVEVSNLKVGDKVKVVITIEAADNMSYVAIEDRRSAAMEPVNQLSGILNTEAGLCFVETKNSSTNYFFRELPAGVHVLSYDCYISHSGNYSAGITEVQSAYSPTFVARSKGVELPVEN